MKYLRILILMLLPFSLAACVTGGEPGYGPLVLDNDTEAAFIAYLATSQYDKGRKWEGAFVINPITNAWNWRQETGGTSSPRSRAINKAIKQCGAGCKVFALDKEIVWVGFEEKDKYDRIARKLANRDSIFVTYYGTTGYKISNQQLSSYQNDYIPDVRKAPHKKWMIAISPDKKTLQYLYGDPVRSHNKYELERTVTAMCNAISGRDDCLIYAHGDVLVR